MFYQFTQRSCELERLDTGDYSAAEYERWHREMWYIHRLFGELRALRRSLIPEIEAIDAGKVSILDIGAGSGELMKCARRFTKKDLFITGIEINSDAALAIRSTGFAAVQADALRLPFADRAFDLVYCSLFLHHLDDDAAVACLREMARVTQHRVVVIDLHRHPVAYYLYRGVGWPFLQKFTREDGALSIRRSFKPDELRDLAVRAGLRDVNVRLSAAFRLTLSGK